MAALIGSHVQQPIQTSINTIVTLHTGTVFTLSTAISG
ncbi:hypothetical protein MMEU_2475 [Mycobacterium marinum str. Europe]|nr:hypothetical protein MMEU_2475 [Mycobacterium marinum str. Europe]